MTAAVQQIARRRTFAIISHPDAGKTTLTEKLLWFGGAIQVAGEIRARKAARHATSDWMELDRIAESWSPWRGVSARLFWAYYAREMRREAAPVLEG